MATKKGGEGKGWRLTQDGRLYKRGRTVYPNKDVYEVRTLRFPRLCFTLCRVTSSMDRGMAKAQ